MKLIYAGIGDQHVRPNVLEYAEHIAKTFDDLGWTLRSNGAEGVATAFAKGSTKKEIYIPGPSYRGGIVTDGIDSSELTTWERAKEIAKEWHLTWDECSEYAKGLHARNVFVIAGEDIKTGADMLIYWKDGDGTHELNHVVRMAERVNIPCFNLCDEDCMEKLEESLNSKNYLL